MGTVTKGLIQRADFDLYDGTLTTTRTSSSGGSQAGLKIGDRVDVLSVFGSGDTSNMNDTTISLALDTIGSSQNIALVFAPGTWTISNTITIASNFTVIAPAGCVFDVASTKTMTIQGVFMREHGTYSSGTGTFTVSGTDALASQDSTSNYAADTGVADAYVITPSPAISSYSAGQRFRFLVTNANTGASTLNVNAKGVKSIVKDVSTALVAGDLVANTIATVDYDGTNFILVNPESVNLKNIVASGTLAVTGASTFTGAVQCNGAFTSLGIDDNADAVALTIDSSERIQVGHTAALTGPSGIIARMQVVGVNTSLGSLALHQHQNGAGGHALSLIHSRNATPGSFTIVQDNDILGRIYWAGDDGVDYQSVGAEIRVEVDGTPGVGDMPSTMTFRTTKDGAESPTTGLTLDKAQNVIVGQGAVLANNATDGFLYIPVTDTGAPTGTPTAVAGAVAMCFDPANKNLYIYNTDASAWESETLS